MRALNCANYLIYILNDSCDDLTNMKLNKLLYYAQGFCLKQNNENMFDDEIEAWQHGPVVPSVYHEYKAFRDDPIHVWDESKIKDIDDKKKGVLFNVARKYSRFTANALRNMTHDPKGLWARFYKPGEKNIVIPQREIKQYFAEHEKELKDLELSFSEDDFIGYRDKDGYLVLPEGWDD